MCIEDFKLVLLLAEKIGIRTAGELDDFKKRTQADSNAKLLKSLALYVACELSYKEFLNV